MTNIDTKHLEKRKDRTIWTIRYVLPKDVRHAFLDNKAEPRRAIMQSTNTDDLPTAQKIRNILVSSIELKIQSVRTGDENLMAPLANLYKQEMKQIKKDDDDSIDQVRDKALSTVYELNLVDATGEEITKARTTPRTAKPIRTDSCSLFCQ